MDSREPPKFTKENLKNLSGCMPELPCAIKRGAKPYELDTQGCYTFAKISEAVKNCPGCLGQAKRIVDNQAQSCMRPDPHHVVNLINSAKIPARYVDAHLEQFQNFTGNGAQIVKQVKMWLKSFKPNGGKGLLITGPVGVGKTYLLAALTRHFAERGHSVKFTDFFQLLADLRAGFSEGKADSALLAPLIHVDILVIDELGKGRGKDFDKTILDQLVSERYKMNKTIIASTNYKLTTEEKPGAYNIDLEKDLALGSDFDPNVFGNLDARVGNRIFSRLREMTHFVELSGRDFRMMNKPYER